MIFKTKLLFILEGLIIASDNIDEVIKIIRASKSPEEARESFVTAYKNARNFEFEVKFFLFETKTTH